MPDTYDPHKTTTEVRGGSRRMLNFRVLIISMVAIVILFALLLWIFSMQTPPTST